LVDAGGVTAGICSVFVVCDGCCVTGAGVVCDVFAFDVAEEGLLTKLGGTAGGAGGPELLSPPEQLKPIVPAIAARSANLLVIFRALSRRSSPARHASRKICISEN
jgi:hypothetical protein